MSEIPSDVKVYSEVHAYNAIQTDVTKDFAQYLKKANTDIKTMVVVGAYHGTEISIFLDLYPNATIYAFEALGVNYLPLEAAFRGNSRVKTFNQCIAAKEGTRTFYELTMAGCGSIKEYQGDKFGSATGVAYTQYIRTMPLSAFITSEIDLLWVDVQGAELEVLQGTNLDQVGAMFLEVKTHEHVKPSDAEPYIGQCFLEHLLDYTKDSHKLISIGLDNENKNGMGNSFWVHKRYLA